ncbi:MAG TPA: site-specific integrase [Vicinamibacterales bacterium]|nr:site-specific integrase [Vicinamibacterales bacterium]
MSRRGKGEGTIFQRDDGRWEGAVSLGFGPNGKRLRKRFIDVEQHVVVKKMNEAKAARQKGRVLQTDERLKLTPYLESWLATLTVRPKTRMQYAWAVAILKRKIGHLRLTRLQPSDLRQMCLELEQGDADHPALSTGSVTLVRNTLRIALSQAVIDRLVVDNVAKLIKRPKPDHGAKAAKVALTRAEARALATAIDGHRLEAMVRLGIGLGMRLGEVLGLRWDDIDVDRGLIRIRFAMQTIRKERKLMRVKSKRARRDLDISAAAIRVIEREKVRQKEKKLAAGDQWQPSEFVFTTRQGRPHDGTLVTRDLKRLCKGVWHGGRVTQMGADGREIPCRHKRTRLDAGRVWADGDDVDQPMPRRVCLDCEARQLPPIGFHGLRHTNASILLEANVPTRNVADRLGHSDGGRLLLQTYAHVMTPTLGGDVVDDVLDGVAGQFDGQSDGQRRRHG